MQRRRLDATVVLAAELVGNLAVTMPTKSPSSTTGIFVMLCCSIMCSTSFRFLSLATVMMACVMISRTFMGFTALFALGREGEGPAGAGKSRPIHG